MDASRQRVSIPIFPLQNVVLFPGVQVPLHIFEPRYRALTADALAGGRVIGMVAVAPEQAQRGGLDPALHPFGCAGAILGAEKLEDGRYNIVLEGTKRFRLDQEIPRPPEQLYRVAEVTLLDDLFDPADESRLREGRREVFSLFAELVRRTDPAQAAEVQAELFARVDDVVFTNTFCQLLELEPLEKQTLLQTDRIAERCEQLATLLRFRLVELSGQLSSTVHKLH
jgi:Lon protease-like protein